MAGVERLRLLFRICNVTGLLPFRMILDVPTKRFKRFESSWRHPTCWWFLILLIGHIFFTVIIALASWNIFSKKLEAMSTVVLVIFILLSSSYAIWISSTRLFLFRFRHLETAFETFHSIDRLLSKTDRPSFNNNTQRRTIIGTVLCLIWVLGLFVPLNV